ncbi:unnamed protein product [Lactuca saligna]|uniref:Uncharacterized protein n=1 Tax=Lactuca saligna TaxID=75948 RepID=A0AA35ZFF7_LACSI|nr:unnamed protein product [Lactuca saligna]
MDGCSRKWTQKEEVELARSWVDISEDGGTGKGQNRDRFLLRITERFCRLSKEALGGGNLQHMKKLQIRQKEAERLHIRARNKSHWMVIWNRAVSQIGRNDDTNDPIEFNIGEVYV